MKAVHVIVIFSIYNQTSNNFLRHPVYSVFSEKLGCSVS